MSDFFEEVRRRKVYRVAAAYIIAAGFIIQIGSAVFPAWELPNWTFRLVVVLLLIGFPISLILAWAYDVTPQGIRATPSVSAPGAHRRRNLIMLIATGVVVSAAAGFFLLPRASAHKIDKSIAVLPFENLSDDMTEVREMTLRSPIFKRFVLTFLAMSHGVWHESRSASYASLVAAIEALLSDHEPQRCNGCGQPIYRISKRFRDFLTLHAPGQEQASERKALQD